MVIPNLHNNKHKCGATCHLDRAPGRASSRERRGSLGSRGCVGQLTLDPIRCTLYVKPGGGRVLTSGQNQLFPSRGYTAETYAKVMGSSSPSQPRIKLKYTLLFC
jgi:hypothetical protein